MRTDGLVDGRRLGDAAGSRSRPYGRPARRGRGNGSTVRDGHDRRDGGNLDAKWEHDCFVVDTGLDHRQGSGGSRHRHGAAAAAAAGDDDNRTESKQTVRVTNLHWDVSSEDLKELFGYEQKQLLSATIKYDSAGRSDGEATLVFASLKMARNAISEYHLRELDGMEMRLEMVDTAKPVMSRLGRAPGSAAGKAGTSGGIIDRLGKPSVFQRLGKTLDSRLGGKSSSTGSRVRDDLGRERGHRADGDWRAARIDMDAPDSQGKQTRFNSRRGYTGSFDERAGARRKEHPSTSASKVSRSQMRAENLDADLDAYMQDVNMDGGGDASFSNDASRAILPPQRRQIISYADTEPSAVDVATL
ncbi:hypothetical protein BASA50_000127 [Batrachochytrium salamandrivorans]|uniref:RRM domain-containing protein n=1 Tax=Batrachochytrium salamandrivorans TaxID=1357716 RepID=A0ABQ8EV86_9FUNG|nr:hypothetical protein BASA50_000127 [Batrachochytrium salamandrivorans]